MDYARARVAGIILALWGATPSAWAGATVALQPVAASGTHTIIGSEVFMPSGGQRVVIEIRLAGWAPQHLKTFQVRIDSSGYDNGSSPIAPANQPCSGSNPTGHAECAQALQNGSRCSVTTPTGRICQTGFQDSLRTDWIASGHSSFPAVDTSSFDYRYGNTTEPPDFIDDPGESLYGGTLVLDVPLGAAGSFVVGINETETFMVDSTLPKAQNIPIESLIPARITIGEPIIPQNRYLSFSPGDPGHMTAVRVILDSLYHPGPPANVAGTDPDFSSFEGQVRWLGLPVDFPERGQPPATFKGAKLQCTPHFADWGSLGAVQIVGEAILPSSHYLVQQAPIECQNDLQNEQCYSSPVELHTARWGDVEKPFSLLNPPVQPDMEDIAAIIDTFRGLSGSLTKSRTQLRGNSVDAAHDLNFIDVMHAADAVRGSPYPYPGPQSCP